MEVFDYITAFNFSLILAGQPVATQGRIAFTSNRDGDYEMYEYELRGALWH